MKPFAVALLVASLGAAGGSSNVTLQSSSIGFKDALAACSAGTMAAISLTLGHVRVAEAPGVASDIDDASPTSQMIELSNGSKGAKVTVNAHAGTVAAKHVTAASSKRVACIAPD
jgi:hypothetical protein